MNASTAASSTLPLRHCYWVVPGLLLAGEHPGGPTRDKTKDRLKKLLGAGIECFVDLTKPTELPRYDTLLPFYVEYARKAIKDHGLPASREQMVDILEYVGNSMRAGRPVYVHCRAGIGRTGTVIGCLLVERGFVGDGALDELNRLWQQSKRSRTWAFIPETEAQSNYVREWQPSLQGGGFDLSPTAAAASGVGPITAAGDLRPGALSVADVQARAASQATGAGQARAAAQNIAAGKTRKGSRAPATPFAGAGLAAAATQARAAVEAGRTPTPPKRAATSEKAGASSRARAHQAATSHAAASPQASAPTRPLQTPASQSSASPQADSPGPHSRRGEPSLPPESTAEATAALEATVELRFNELMAGREATEQKTPLPAQPHAAGESRRRRHSDVASPASPEPTAERGARQQPPSPPPASPKSASPRSAPPASPPPASPRSASPEPASPPPVSPRSASPQSAPGQSVLTHSASPQTASPEARDETGGARGSPRTAEPISRHPAAELARRELESLQQITEQARRDLDSLRSAAELASAQADATRHAPPRAPVDSGARQTSPQAPADSGARQPASQGGPTHTTPAHVPASEVAPRAESAREATAREATPQSIASPTREAAPPPLISAALEAAPQEPNTAARKAPDVDPLLDPETLMAARALRERFVGALLGLAVGDAVAAATQFRRPGTFTPVGDMIGGGPFDLPRGAWSDDTAMALCLAESLLETNGFDPRDQIQRYTRWQQEGYLSSTGQCVGITASTARSLAIAQWRRVVFPGSHDPEQPDPEPLSRIAPIALYYLASVETTQQQAAEASRTTCQAPSVLEACRQLGGALHAALSAQPKDRILAEVPAAAAGGAEQPSNTATAALAAAVWAFATTDNFREAILRAANVGGNSDVVASICGQLAGAHYGFSAIPSSWRNGLMHKDLIEGYADRLLAHALVCLSGAPAAS